MRSGPTDINKQGIQTKIKQIVFTLTIYWHAIMLYSKVIMYDA